MSQLKRQLVMLPTQEGSYLSKRRNGKLEYYYCPETSYVTDSEYTNQHLYVLGGDSIRAGEPYMWMDNKAISTATTNDLIHLSKHLKEGHIKPILATTDRELYNRIPMNGGHFLNASLPKLRDSFVSKFMEQYNKGNVLTDVMVEYEDDLNQDDYDKDGFAAKCRLKLDNGCIITHKVQNSFTREEMLENMQYYMEHVQREGYVTPEVWLEFKHF